MFFLLGIHHVLLLMWRYKSKINEVKIFSFNKNYEKVILQRKYKIERWMSSRMAKLSSVEIYLIIKAMYSLLEAMDSLTCST